MLRCTSEFEIASSRLALGVRPFFVTGALNLQVGHKRERVLGRVGRAVNAAARDFARARRRSLKNGGGREAAAERLVEQQIEVVALDKDRVVVETAMRLTQPWPFL